jgi:ATPase subunit of ABC transporter with duplicated ATPase domains
VGRDYAGCVMVISHDRPLLDRVATHTLGSDADQPTA